MEDLLCEAVQPGQTAPKFVLQFGNVQIAAHRCHEDDRRPVVTVILTEVPTKIGPVHLGHLVIGYYRIEHLLLGVLGAFSGRGSEPPQSLLAHRN